jgi:hypothetical protein
MFCGRVEELGFEEDSGIGSGSDDEKRLVIPCCLIDVNENELLLIE